ncbi:MAG: HAMP domain-containing histidine kinase, partial [Magnetococcales bacterium]|nr:HAMP domain-containing histidine kinase [Magnetococcales bacterium]
MTPNPVPEIIESLCGVHWALLDADGVIVAVNNAWSAFSAHNGGVGDYVGANYLEICSQALQANNQLWEAKLLLHHLRDHLDDKVDEPAPTVCYSCHAPDEHRWFEVSVNPCQRAGVKHLLIVHRNVTAQKKLEFSRERALGMILHDLRGPVGSLHNVLDLLLSLEKDPERKRLLTSSLQTGRRALELITSHARFIALEQGGLHLEYEELDLSAMIDTWRQIRANQIRYKKQVLKLHMGQAPEAPVTHWERTLMQSVLDNLLT